MILPQDNPELQEWIGDDFLRIQAVDYLEPIVYDNFRMASSYASFHRCGECRQQLIAVIGEKSDNYQVVCPEGHEITRKTVLTNKQAQIASDNEHFGQIMIDALNKPRRTEEEILKELGF